jgi:hypothetical protein
MMWIPAQVGVRGNERADQLTGDAVENGIEWHAPVGSSDFLPLSRMKLLVVICLLVCVYFCFERIYSL